MSLAGTQVAVLGAGAAGRALAAALGSEGSVVHIVDRSSDLAHEALAASGATGQAYALDLSSPDDVVAWLDRVHDSHGTLDGVVHLVGGWAGGKGFGRHSLDHHDALVTPVLATLQVSTALMVDDLRSSHRGFFAMVSSVSVAAPTAGNAAYASLKAAAESWTMALAHELRDTSASATVLRIKAIVTEDMRAQKPEASFVGATSPEALARAIVQCAAAPAAEVNGVVIDLTSEGYSAL
jgi:NAD(P)-dependent dehydrogenase (short-subunit alcohol dehydrogenase family)